MVINNNYVGGINKVLHERLPQEKRTSLPEKENFNEILKQKIDTVQGLKFSKHAEMRLQARNIQLSQIQKDKVFDAVKRAEQKGVKDSLVLVDNIAFVVNVKNRTVVTAVNSNELKDNVFTNIDGAVFG